MHLGDSFSQNHLALPLLDVCQLWWTGITTPPRLAIALPWTIAVAPVAWTALAVAWRAGCQTRDVRSQRGLVAGTFRREVFDLGRSPTVERA